MFLMWQLRFLSAASLLALLRRTTESNLSQLRGHLYRSGQVGNLSLLAFGQLIIKNPSS